MFHASAKITPTSTGPTVEASPALPRVPGSHRGLDSRRTPSFLRTETQRTSALSSAGWRHPMVIFHLVVVDPAGKAERSAESRLRPGRPPRPRRRAPQPWRSGRNPRKSEIIQAERSWFVPRDRHWVSAGISSMPEITPGERCLLTALLRQESGFTRFS